MALAIDVSNSKTFNANPVTATNWTSNAITTTSANEAIFVLCCSNNAAITAVSGGGLTWVQVFSTGNGSANGFVTLFRSFASSILTTQTLTCTNAAANGVLTVLSLTGANNTGTNGSASVGATASSTLTATGNISTSVTLKGVGSWVFGLMTCWSAGRTITTNAGQTILQTLSSLTADSYATSEQNTANADGGAIVTMNFNGTLNTDTCTIAAFEVLAAPPTEIGNYFRHLSVGDGMSRSESAT